MKAPAAQEPELTDDELAALSPRDRYQYIARMHGGVYGKPQEHKEQPGDWHGLVMYVADNPVDHDLMYRRTPLLRLLCYAERKAEREHRRSEAYAKAAKKGNPFALLFLLMS